MNKKQQRLAAIQRQQELVNAAKAANRSLSESEQAEFDSLQSKIDTLTREIADEERQQQQPAPAAPAATNAPTADQVREAIEAERSRFNEITAMARDFNMDLQRYIDDGSTVDQVRAAVLQNLRSNHAPIPAGAVHTEAIGEDNFRRDISDALMLRANVTPSETPSSDARRMASMSIRDIAIECLSREGRNVNELLRMSATDLYDELGRQFYNPTAAFPAILDQTIRKSIVQLYNAVPTTFEAFVGFLL